MIRAGIIGSTGYAGAELVRLLLGHPNVRIVWYGSRSYVGKPFAAVYGNLFRIVQEECLDDNIEQLSKEADVIFTATPQGLCASLVSEEILGRAKVIDLSADFRLKDVAVYEKWYGISHANPSYIREAVYGLCELNRDKIRNTRLLANPGCYTTCSILTLYPLVKEGIIDPDSIIIDAKSGTSGAGRGAKVQNLFCEVNESIKAYGVATHRHTPEIEEQLGYAAGRPLMLSFTPHLVPMNRGILATCYASLNQAWLRTLRAEAEGACKNADPADKVRSEGVQAGGAAGEKRECVREDQIRNAIRAAYDKYYRDEYFIRLLDDGVLPETRWVEGSNFADIGFKVDPRTGRIIAVGAIDNLIKGAAGQAVQNMNLMFGLDEKTGLAFAPLFP